MQKTRKRKQEQQLQQHSCSNKTTTKQEPYPTHTRPTPEDCLAIRDDLLAHHGFPQEFVKHRIQRLNQKANTEAHHESVKSEPLDGDGEEETVLDGLVKTVLSQNTAEVNSLKAFASLKSAFPTWEGVSSFTLFLMCL